MPSIPTDYHMHSTFSPDGRNSPAELCRRALALGLTEIAITEHAEWLNGWNGFPKVHAYFEAIEACRAEFGPQGLRLLSGVELGNPHQHRVEATALVESYPFDVVIASLHRLHGHNIHDAACFRGREPEAVYAAYFEEFGRMAAAFPADFVGHFDRIFWRGTLLGAPLRPRRLERVIREAMAAVADQKMALELNTRFVGYSLQWDKTLATLLSWFAEAGGTDVVVNSDAHGVGELARNFDRVPHVLAMAGFDVPGRRLEVRTTS